MGTKQRIQRFSDRYMTLACGLNKAYMRAEQQNTPELQDLIKRLETKKEIVRRQSGYLVYGMAFDILETQTA